MHCKVLADLFCDFALLERDKGIDGLSGQLVGNTNDSSLGNRSCSWLVWAQLQVLTGTVVALTVLEKSSLDLSGGQTVSRNVDDIVDTTADPVVAVVVTPSTISGELYMS